MRPLGVGRKNWLFFLNDNGADAAMVHLSLLRTAEAVGVNGMDYFRDVLTRIDREPDLEKLLPLAWKEHFSELVEDRRSAALGILTGKLTSCGASPSFLVPPRGDVGLTLRLPAFFC